MASFRRFALLLLLSTLLASSLPSLSLARRRESVGTFRRLRSPSSHSSSSFSSSSSSSCPRQGSAGVFDFYVFALSSSPEYCAASSASKYPGCAHPTAWQRVNLTIHGLWPQYTEEQSGSYGPECCASQYPAQLSSSVVAPVLPQLQLRWPNEEDPTGSSIAQTLWQHEWAHHGTCSGLAQADFLNAALQLSASNPTPTYFSENVGSSVTRDALESAFNGGAPCTSDAPCMVFLECSGSTLAQVDLCFTKADLSPMECPASVTSARSRCAAGNVHLDAFKSGGSSSSKELR